MSREMEESAQGISAQAIPMGHSFVYLPVSRVMWVQPKFLGGPIFILS